MELESTQPLFPDNENERLKALSNYNIISNEIEAEFDEIVKLATNICETPIGLITFVDADKQWLKSKIGVSITQTERSVSFCSHAILNPHEIMIVDDAREDARFANNPLVKGDPNIVFFAGMPLVDESGYALGTLCAIDNKPRKLTQNQIEAIKILSKQVVNMLHLRLKNVQLNESKKRLTESINFSSPYYLLLDNDDQILSFGINFNKSMPEVKVGKFFSTYFMWQSVFNTSSLLSDKDKHERLLFFESLDRTKKFKCTVRKNDEDSYFIFAVPVINTLYPIANYQINITNFPRQDYIAEYLFLQQSATRGLEDFQKLNQSISDKNKKLEEAKNTLIKANSTLEERINAGVQKIKNLALFPEQNPNPVIEIGIANTDFIYLNPAARRLMGYNEDNVDLAQIKKNLQISDDVLTQKNSSKIEIEINNHIFERNVFFNEQFSSIRFYLHDITQIKAKEKEEKLKTALFRKKQETLNRIRKISDELSLQEKFKLICKALAQVIKCDRCSIWLLNEEMNSITTNHVYLLEQDTFVDGIEIKYETAPKYFKSLERKSPLLIYNTLSNEGTMELSDNYLIPLNIMSMLKMPLLQGEETIGLLCCEFLEVQDEFSADTVAFCASVSDIIVLAFETEGLKQSKQELEIKNKLLKENMDQIINMQSEIIDREKLATLGMLIAGIAHEINSPLGAIKASNDFLHRIFIDSFITSIKNLTPETIKVGLGLFALLDYKLVANTTKDIRMFQKELLAKLNTSFPALENKVFYANVLMELGLQNKSEQYENYINHPDKRNIFYFTQQLVDISKSVNTISLAVNRAGAVVKALNTFSHGSVDYEIGSFNLHESISSVITLLWNKIKYSAYIENTIPTEINITGNADELSQVWTNIINNALQASDNKCTISIEYAEDAKNHIISISNNGPAIPEDIIPKIFDAFFSTKKRGEGTGLGLNIIKKIIEKHQGNIVCHSNSSKTTFLISLPKVLNENSVA